MTGKKTVTRKKDNTGRLKIGDHWNAITIIALSQNSPLKAIAEFVENSIDAHAKNVTIVRGKERGEIFLKVIDDGEGVPLNDEGIPDFKYVATHICDSIKKKLKQEGMKSIQGEYGIGLLSFWTVGERLVLSSGGSDGRAYQMEMKKDEPGYTITPRRSLFSHPGTELTVHPILPGIRQLNGERIQHYLASELRDRIRKSGVTIGIKDRYSRKEYEVKPRQFSGRMLADFDSVDTELGDIFFELYLQGYDPGNSVGLYRSGTRVLSSITDLDFFDREPWNTGYLQGMIDAPFLQLTPGTRGGIIHDEKYRVFCDAFHSIEENLRSVIELEKKAEEEVASKNVLKSVQRALKEAFLALPTGEYDWFDITAGRGKKTGAEKMKDRLFKEKTDAETAPQAVIQEKQEQPEPADRAAFYESAGPLFSAVISPASCVVKVGTTRNFRCIPRDRSRRTVERELQIRWEIKEGEGAIDKTEGEFVTFTATQEPGMVILVATVSQGEVTCTAESIITVTDSLLDKIGQDGKGSGRGIPGYTFVRAPGELWRSRFDEDNNLIIINNGHKDYIYASRKKARKLKYICRLFAKELVLHNFIGFDAASLLERMIELTLYTEEHLH
ncbi:MAG: ATP-binding protein [Spirochaetes bacterium]|nr:ATP-binding protein [Spirochaetota bacterium]